MTAVGTDAHCLVDLNEPFGSGPDQAVDVFCYDPGTGLGRDTQFTLAYLG